MTLLKEKARAVTQAHSKKLLSEVGKNVHILGSVCKLKLRTRRLAVKHSIQKLQHSNWHFH
jgi:hypothetical protein